MADAAAVLRANGMGLVDELIRAAQLEGIALPIAATIIAGESWGRNVYGHDTTVTAGTYTPGGPVTQANYLAYRSAMRAGRIKRNGVGPAQCTSAQYQDTADALGGCWDPLANYRSGFRGMGALMKRYGTRDGARRYNGSGARAETYANNFMARLATWQGRLAGATAPNVPIPRPQEDDLPTPLEVWAHPIADPYTAANDYQPAFAMLGWAAAHAAHAREAAIRAEAAAARCEQKLDQLLARLA